MSILKQYTTVAQHISISMMRVFRLGLTFVLALILMLLMQLYNSPPASADVSLQPPLLVATQEWPPYQMLVNGEPTGHAVDALTCVMNKLNFKYKLVFLPWGRAQKEVEMGRFHAFFSAAKNSTRDKYAVMSTPFIQQDWDFYQLASTTNLLTEKEQFMDAIFGSRPHSNTTHWLLKNNYKVAYQDQSVETLIGLLLRGKVEAMMDNRLLFQQAINKLGIPASTFNAIPNRSLPLGIYFSNDFARKHPKFIEQFNLHTQGCQFKAP